MSYQVNHVLMTADAVGGVWTYCMELAYGLAQHGIRTTLVTMGPPPSEEQSRQAELIPDLDLIVGVFRLEWMPEPWAEVDAAGAWLLALAERVKPDVVHLNGFCHAALPWKVPTLAFAHSDCLSWWQAVKGEPAPLDAWGEYAKRVHEGLQAANLVAAPTQAMLKEADRIYGPLENTRVIHNGCDGSEYDPSLKRELVFSAGRFWDEAKNVRLLEEVAPAAKWPIYLAGDGGESTAEIPNLFALGRLYPNSMRAMYHCASIYALPAKYEPFGLSILEAARCGCALVLGDIPTLRELWDDAAVFLDTNDPAAWTDAINDLASDRARREELSRLALERSRLYSARNMCCATLFAYQDLLQASVLDSTYHSGAFLL